MTLTDIGELILNNPSWIAIIAVIVPSLIEIVPVKCNPWSALAKGIGKAINKDVLKELDSVKQSQDNISKQLGERIEIEDARNADAQREYILHFNMELIQGTRHTFESFREVLLKMDAYKEYCEAHPKYKNHRAEAAVENINRVYMERLKESDFKGISESEASKHEKQIDK